MNKIKFGISASKIIKNNSIIKMPINEITNYLHTNGMPKSITVINKYHTMMDTMNDGLDIIIEGPDEDIKNYIGKNYLILGWIEC